MAQLAILYPPVAVRQDDPGQEIMPKICLAAVTAGQAVYEDPTTGKVGVADASSAGKHQFAGIVLAQAKGAGQAATVMRRGLVAGFDLTSQAFGTLIFLDTAGALADAANGTTTVPVGRVVASSRVNSGGTLDKLLELVSPITISY